jgi:Tfp pilus assembly protein PilF
MKYRPLVAQGTIVRLLAAGQTAFQEGKYAESFEIFERARRLAPANPQLLVDVGGFHARRNELTKATECFDRAIKLTANKTAILEAAGRQCKEASAFELAKNYLEQAATQKDISAEGLATLGWIYERLRRMEDATVSVDRALQKNPASATAILIKARLERAMGDYTAAEARLRGFTTSREEITNRVLAAYELGALLDKQGRFDEAMAAFQHAKDLQKPKAAQYLADLKLTRDRLGALAESLTPEILKRWHAEGQQLQAPVRMVLLGGHPRSGTTLLEQVVDTHPEIVSAEETDVFINDAYQPMRSHLPITTPILDELEGASLDSLRHARQTYLRRIITFLEKPLENRLLVDKNPSLTLLVPVLARIFPEIKFLTALRDPRDVCMSCFMQPVLLHQVSSAWLSMEGTVNEYITLMGAWRQTLPKLPQATLEVRYEDMVADLEPVARKTLEFLGVAWDPKVLGFDEHARQKAVRSPTYSDVTKKVFKTAVGRWRNYQKYFEPHLAKLEPLVKALGYE